MTVLACRRIGLRVAAPLVIGLISACASSSQESAQSGGAGASGAQSRGGSSAGGNPSAGGGVAGQVASSGAGSGGGAPIGTSGSGGGDVGGDTSSGAGSGGMAGSGGGAGATGGSPQGSGKGAAAKDVCAGLSGFSDPSQGMGVVAEVKAPQESFFAFTEGPVWIASAKLVFFSDNAGSPERIWSFDPATQAVGKVLEGSASNGLAVDSRDQLLVANQIEHAIYRLDPLTKAKVGGNFATGAYKPNDLIARSDGGIYLTDPDTGVWYIPAGGEAQLATKSVNRPNGIALSLDENTLIIGDVGNQSITKFPLTADGKLTDTPTAFGKTTGAVADGMCMDCAGNLYVSTQTGVEIIDPSGKALGVVPTGEASNCTFGGEDRKTLFVSSRAVLKVVKLANPGLPD